MEILGLDFLFIGSTPSESFLKRAWELHAFNDLASDTSNITSPYIFGQASLPGSIAGNYISSRY